MTFSTLVRYFIESAGDLYKYADRIKAALRLKLG